MSDYEPFDDELAAAMRRRSAAIDPSGLSTATAHDAVLARARGIRRRRAGVAGGLTMVALVAGGFLLLDGGADDDTLAPASDPSTTLPVETLPVPSSTLLAPTTSVDPSPTTAPPSTTSPTAPTVAQTVAPTSAPTLPTTVAPPPADTSTTTAATNPPQPTTETQTSAGGSITYTWDGSSLDLLSTQPASGHTVEIEDDTSTRIRVRFRGPSDSRIEVRVEGGVPVVDID
jgi:hypothetical protein